MIRGTEDIINILSTSGSTGLSDSDNDDDNHNKTAAVTKPVSNLRSNRKMAVYTCMSCQKEFDGSAVNADVANRVCSVCNPGIAYPDLCEQVNKNTTTNVKSKLTATNEKSCNISDDDSDDSDDDDNNHVSAEDIADIDDDLFIEELDDDDAPEQPIPDFVDEDCEEEDNYSGCKSGKELSDHMVAAILAQQPFGEKINGEMVEFNQVKDPDDYSVERKHGLFKIVKDPHRRGKKLIMYGYDLFDAWHYKETGLLCLSMIMRQDGEPTGYIMFKLAKTRCAKPRVDAFLYHVREDQ